MLCKRIIACLDVDRGRVVKGRQFQELGDAGDPAERARSYENAGADEIVVLDITASVEHRQTTIDTVARVAREIAIPLTVGGGVRGIDDVTRLLTAGADKVAINTAAVGDPSLIRLIADRYGSQCCVVAVDARRTESSTWEVLTHGGRKASARDAIDWCVYAGALGAGEILLTSWDRDGTNKGFDIELTRQVSTVVAIPVIASGGAGEVEHFAEVFVDGKADAALAAGVFHRGEIHIRDIKQHLTLKGVSVRLC